MKRVIFAVLLGLLAIPLFATTYIIDDYKFIFYSNTDANVVYKKLGLEENIGFESYEALQAYVKAKEQEIANWNIFNKTSSAVVELSDENYAEGAGVADEEKHYTVVYDINDKFPIVVFPVPKYDSNTGASLGVGVASENFAGKLAHFFSQFTFEQKDKTFENANYALEFFLDRFPIDDFNLDCSLAFLYDGLTDKLSLDFTTRLYNLQIGDVETLDFKTLVKLNPAEDGKFGVEKFSYLATFENLVQSLGGFTFTQGFNYYLRSQEIETNNILTYYGIKIKDTTALLKFEVLTTNKTQTQSAVDVTMKESFSVPFDLSYGFTLTPSLTLINAFTRKPDKLFTVSATLTRSALNKDIDGNQDFRKGDSLSLSVYRNMPLEDLTETSSQYANLSFSLFPYANLWLNPSMRISGIVSMNAVNNLTSDSTEATSSLPASYLRGIRDDNKYVKDLWNTILIANFDIKTKVLSLGSWASLYVTPFADVGYFTTFSSEAGGGSSHWLCSVGIEAIGVLNNIANYPLRISLGFNTETFNTEELEYELFFGLNLFY